MYRVCFFVSLLKKYYKLFRRGIEGDEGREGGSIFVYRPSCGESQSSSDFLLWGESELIRVGRFFSQQN